MVISVLWFQDTTYRPDPGLTSSAINCVMQKSVKKFRQLSKNWPVCYVCSPAVTKWTTELQNRTLHNIFFSTLLLPGQSVTHQLRDLCIICLSCIFQQWVCFSPLLISMWTLRMSINWSHCELVQPPYSCPWSLLTRLSKPLFLIPVQNCCILLTSKLLV